MCSVYIHYPKLEPAFLTGRADLKLWYSMFLYSLTAFYILQVGSYRVKRNYALLSLILGQYISLYYDHKYMFVLDLFVFCMITLSMIESIVPKYSQEQVKVNVKVD
jgi:hypothetical protein